MGRTLQRAVAVVVLTAIAALPLAAQGKWHELYDRGVKAFQARSYSQAASLLEQAIAADPKDGAGKVIEGTFRTDYFPYYYLGLAYLELKQYKKAEENLARAKATLPRSQQAKYDEANKRIRTETAIAVVTTTTTTAPIVKPPDLGRGSGNAVFDAAMKGAADALGNRDYAEAVRLYEIARRTDAAAFSQQTGQARLDEAVRGVTGQRLAAEGRDLLNRLDISGAETKFEQANLALPGQRAVADGLTDIRTRRENYQRFKNEAEQSIQSGAFAAAQSKFGQAKAENPQQFTADRLEERVQFAAGRLVAVVTTTTIKPIDGGGGGGGGGRDSGKGAQAQQMFDRAKLLAGQGQYAEADKAFSSVLQLDPGHQGADQALKNSRRFAQLRSEANDFSTRGNAAAAIDWLTEARRLDPKRFEDEKLTTLLDRLLGDKPADRNKEKDAFRDGLVALIRGDAPSAAGILETAVTRARSDSQQAAGMRAYLGVAYAMQALTSPVANDAVKELRDKAGAQFRLALRAQRDYQLSARIVSPKIVEMFEEARRGQ